MSFLLKIGYYGTSGVSALVVGFFFLANLFGPKRPGETWRNTAVLLVSGVAGIGLLIWSMRVGHYRGQWLAGTGLAIAAVVVFGVMMFAGLLLFTRVHWQ